MYIDVFVRILVLCLVPTETKESVGSPGIRFIDGCELLYGCDLAGSWQSLSASL